MAEPTRAEQESERQEPRLVLAPPARPGRSRRRRFHVAAIVAALVYAGAALVAYELYRSAWYGEGRIAGGGAADAGGEADEAETLAATSQERAAMRALAARAQQSVYVVESTGSGQGSGFVAWVMQGDSYVITAHRTVAGVLEQGGRTVFVRRGSQIWTGRIVRAHLATGLVLIRVSTDLGRALWQERADAATLEPGGSALIVPAGPDAAIGEGTAGRQERGRIPVQAHGERLNLGAPVLGENGRLAGVVTQTEPGGVSLVVPIEGACEAGIRRCR